jgi:cellulose synthase/poly-beta-1,6-N-acetylglucosamine synthase-like glycosyltransferase
VTLVFFWALVGVVAYAYFGYPPTVAVAGLLLDRKVGKAPVTPRVSVIIAAFDEGADIEARLRNVLDSRYPHDRLEVVVASDGSTDDTVGVASAVDPTRVQVLDLPRRGKAAALADGAYHATGEVLVFTDANTMFEPDALAMLARNFADPDVGGVAGRTQYVVTAEAESAGRGEDLYWRYDTWLKGLETKTGSVVSAHGGMYAIRRDLFRPVEDAAVTDDFAISTAIVAQGKRLVFERDAVGRERTMVESGTEFRRRVRLMTRGLTGVLLRRRLLNPFRYGFYAVALASRKVLRRVLPLAFPPLVLVTLLLAPTSTFFAALAVAQVAFAALALGGWALRGTALGKQPLFYVPFFFTLANVASVVALWNVLRGMRIERWTPQRHAPSTRATAGTGAAAGARTP